MELQMLCDDGLQDLFSSQLTVICYGNHYRKNESFDIEDKAHVPRTTMGMRETCITIQLLPYIKSYKRMFFWTAHPNNKSTHAKGEYVGHSLYGLW